jgi:hypothetical protein
MCKLQLPVFLDSVACREQASHSLLCYIEFSIRILKDGENIRPIYKITPFRVFRDQLQLILNMISSKGKSNNLSVDWN